jgi:hypothetical protein
MNADFNYKDYQNESDFEEDEEIIKLGTTTEERLN